MGTVIAFPAHRASRPSAAVDHQRNAEILILPVVRIMRAAGLPVVPPHPERPDRLVR